MNKQLVLASGSPRRKELLSLLGYPFLIDIPGIEECQREDERPDEYVRRLSRSKARAIFQKKPQNQVVLGADTIVVIDQLVLEKPRDFDHSKRMLMTLSGQCHQVMTAISLISEDKVKTVVVSTNVWFKELTEKDIIDYWYSGEPQDKAGSYGIQGLGGKFVVKIEGSYHAVVGLPLFETAQLLNEFL